MRARRHSTFAHHATYFSRKSTANAFTFICHAIMPTPSRPSPDAPLTHSLMPYTAIISRFLAPTGLATRLLSAAKHEHIQFLRRPFLAVSKVNTHYGRGHHHFCQSAYARHDAASWRHKTIRDEGREMLGRRDGHRLAARADCFSRRASLETSRIEYSAHLITSVYYMVIRRLRFYYFVAGRCGVA